MRWANVELLGGCQPEVISRASLARFACAMWLTSYRVFQIFLMRMDPKVSASDLAEGPRWWEERRQNVPRSNRKGQWAVMEPQWQIPWTERRKDVVLVNQQTWLMAKVASGPGDLCCTVVFLFFLFQFSSSFSPLVYSPCFSPFFSSFISHFFSPSFFPLSFCKCDSVFEIFKAGGG